MVVYADILVAVNTVVDYFLIRAAETLLKYKIGALKLILASVFGGLSSLYIFINSNTEILDFFYQIFICVILSLICFGSFGIKKWLLSTLVLFTVNCSYTGFIIVIYTLFKPNGLIIKNSVIYYQISPVLLIVFTACFYIIFSLLRFFFSKTSSLSEKCILKITANGKAITLDAIIDTGNSIEDALSNSEIIITDKKGAVALFGEKYESDEELLSRYRKIPCGTVTGKGLLDAYRCDLATAQSGEKSVKLIKPILVIADTKLDDCEAIVNPRIFS